MTPLFSTPNSTQSPVGSTFTLYLKSDPSLLISTNPLGPRDHVSLDYCVSPPPSPDPLVQSLSHIRPSVTPWIVARQASLSITNWSVLKLMSIKSVMASNHLILCHPLVLP